MKTGSKWQLFIPAELAFGQAGMSSAHSARCRADHGNRNPRGATSQPAAGVRAAAAANPPLTSDIVKVPSAEEMNKGAKIEIIKPEDVQKYQQAQTNAAK